MTATTTRLNSWQRLQPYAEAELTRRRTEARRLRSSAGSEWAAAKARFEQELLGKSLRTATLPPLNLPSPA